MEKNVYMMAWGDGTITFVSADDRDDAAFLLDELGAVSPDSELLVDVTDAFMVTVSADVVVGDGDEGTDTCIGERLWSMLCDLGLIDEATVNKIAQKEIADELRTLPAANGTH